MPSYEDDAMMARFVTDYLALLEQRVITIQAQLRTGRLTTAQIAMLSLESTSTMVGATEMATIVGRLRAALERGDLPALPELSRAMVAETDHVRLQLGSPKRS